MKDREKRIFDWLSAHKEDIIADLLALVRSESPTGDKVNFHYFLQELQHFC